jgi:thermitase
VIDRVRNWYREVVSSTPRLVAAIAVLVIVVGAASYGAYRAFGPAERGVLPLPPTQFVQGEFLVKFKPGAARSDIAALHAQNKVQELDTIPGIGVNHLKVPAGSSVGEMVNAYIKNPNVEFAEPNYIRKGVDAPNDSLYSKEWNAAKIGLPQAWDITKGSASVLIAVLDSGIALAHEDLVGRYQGSPAADDYGHGTQVAGIIGATAANAKGIAGVCPQCTLLSYKVLDSTGSGSDSAVASAIIAAADAGAKVINMSLGAYASSQTTQDAVNYAFGKGAVLVGAAGNDATSTPFYPAAYANVISVGGTDSTDLQTTTTNFGPWVKVVAPGQAVPVPTMAGSYTLASGTSMAAPHVAGLAGLLFSAKPGIANTQVVSLIQANVDAVAGGPRINACLAVTAAIGGTCGQATSTTTLTTPQPTVATTTATLAPTPQLTDAATPTPSVAAAGATPTPTPTPAPTATRTPKFTPTPSPTSTIAPSATPLASPTSAPATITETFTGSVSKSGTAQSEFTVSVQGPGLLTATLGGWSGSPSKNNLQVYLLSGSTQLAAATGPVRPQTLTFDVDAGTYTLRVVAKSGSGNFTLTVTHP